MYVRRGINFRHLFHDSWRFLVLTILWSVSIVYLYEIRGYTYIGIPMMPITIVGIAVSLYLGFKSTSAYNRWWYENTEEGRETRRAFQAQLDCMSGILPSRAVLDELDSDDSRSDYFMAKIDLGRRIRAECEQVDCVAEAEGRYGPLAEFNDATRRKIHIDYCWGEGIPTSWRLARPSER